MTSASTMRRARPLLVLALLAIGLGLLVLRDRSTSEGPTRRLAPAFHAAQATTFSLYRDGVTLRFERRSAPQQLAGWWLVGGGRADQRGVDELLATVEWAVVERRIAGAAALPASSGLTPPRLGFSSAGLHLAVGGPDALGRGIYVQLLDAPAGSASARGGAIVVSDPMLATRIDVLPQALQDTTPLGIRLDDAGTLTLRRRPNHRLPSLHLLRRGADWVLGPLPGSRLSPPALTGLLAALTQTRGQLGSPSLGPAPGRKHSDLPCARQDDETGTIFVVDGTERARITGCCAPAGVALWRWDAVRLCLPRGALAAALVAPEVLIDPHPWPFAPEAVVAFTLGDGPAALALERTSGGWRMHGGGASGTQKADDDAVRERLMALAAFTATPSTDELRPEPTSGPPAVALASQQRGEQLRLTTVGSAHGQLVVIRDREPLPLLCDPAFASLLAPVPRDFRVRRVLALRPGEIERLEVDLGPGRPGVAVVRQNDVTSTWRSVTPAQAIVADRIEQLVAAVSELRAASFAARTAQDGLDVPRRRLTLTTYDRRTVRLRITATHGARCRGQLDGDADTFLLDGAICRLLLAPVTIE